MTCKNLKRILFDVCLSNGLRESKCFELARAAKYSGPIAERIVEGGPLMKWQRAAIRRPNIMVAFVAADFDISMKVTHNDWNRVLSYVVKTGLFSLIPKAVAGGAAPNEIEVNFYDNEPSKDGPKVPLICKAACMRDSRGLERLLEAGAALDNEETLRLSLNLASESDLSENMVLLRTALSACELRKGIRSAAIPGYQLESNSRPTTLRDIL